MSNVVLVVDMVRGFLEPGHDGYFGRAMQWNLDFSFSRYTSSVLDNATVESVD
jgi:hypothetical protein